MKTSLKKMLSLLLVLTLVFSIFASLITTASAATFSYNTGKRGTVCTSLSSKAKSYYTSSYTYSTLSAKSASSLKSSLKTLMTNTHSTKTSYTNLKTYTKYSDAYAGSSSKIVDFYSSETYSGTWDSGSTWNREHVWCQSLGSFTTSNCGSDLHHLRPTDPKLNSTRNNLPFGEVSGSYKTATSNSGKVGGYYNSTCFEPLDAVKGDVARILLYCYVRWGESNLSDLISTTDLLNWMKQDPVDTYEMGRNDVVQGIQGNRNVFIDYPEYAWLIFSKSIPSHTTPSGMAAGGSGTSSGSTTTTPTYTVTATSNNTSYGTVSVSGYTITCYPKTGYEVGSASVVSGSATGSINGNTITLTPTSDCTIRVNFVASTTTDTGTTNPYPYTVTATSNNTSYGTVSVSGYTVTCYPKAGYEVGSASVVSGSVTGSIDGNTITLTPTSDCTIRVNFVASTTTDTGTTNPYPYTVTATSNNTNYGTVSVSGYTVTCYPKAGYEVGSASVVSGSVTGSINGNTITLTPTSDCTIRVNFVASTTTDTGSDSGTDSGTSSSGYTFTRVTSTSNLTSGTYVLVVKVGTGSYAGNSTYYALMGKSMNSSYVAAASADAFMGTGSAPSTITLTDTSLMWDLTKTSGGVVLKNGSYYLRGSSNYLYYNSSSSYTTWSASVSNGVWTLKNGTRYLALRPDLQLGSNGCPRFRCNSSASSTNYQFYLYKLVEG
ncbi:MAG: endonuclease [Oscillospiraceae bacterium]|nr:endonuclease [Oscillospiraceae bacterium]